MKKILIVFIFSLLSLQSFALEREIVILTSIQNPKKRPFWRSKSYEIAKDIEKQYTRAFKNSGYKVVFHHNTDRETLESYLQSPAPLALFWVSHAADEAQINGLSFSSIIQDVNGNNVKNIFQKINPNIKFLSVVGCNAKNILNEFKNKGLYHADLTINSFDKKISLNNGIDLSLKASSKILDIDADHFRNPLDTLQNNHYRDYLIGKNEFFDTDIIGSTDIEGISFTIINTNPQYSAELNINGQFIGVLKKGTSPQSFIIPSASIVKKIKLKVDFDISSLNETNYLNPLELSSNEQSFSVDYLKDGEGRPYGRGTNFYYISVDMP